MSWQILLFINIIFVTFRSYLDKKLVGKIEPFIVFFYAVFWEGIFLTLLLFYFSGKFPVIYPEMMILGVLFGLGVGAYFEAIKINMSQSVIFSSYYMLISLVLSAVFLGEWRLFSLSEGSGQKTLLGVILAIVSMMMILKGSSKKEEKMEKKWVILIGFNILVNGIGTFWGKAFLETHEPIEALFSQVFGGILTLLIYNIIKRNNFHIRPKYHKFLVLDGLLMMVAVVAFYMVLKVGPLAVVLPIQNLVLTILMTLVGLIIFKEAHNMNMRKMVGMGLGVVGVVLLMI